MSLVQHRIKILILSGQSLPLSSPSTTSRNSRLVVDEENFKWVTNEKEILLLLNSPDEFWF